MFLVGHCMRQEGIIVVDQMTGELGAAVHRTSIAERG